MLMQWGSFQFEINTAAFDELQRKHAWRWPVQAVIGATPIHQYTGEEEETLQISGVVYAAWRGGTGQIDAVRTIAAAGAVQSLMDGTGKHWGGYACRSISETQQFFLTDGRPLKQAFSIEFVRVNV